jgi:adenylate cyclase
MEWSSLAVRPIHIEQYYLSITDDCSIRVRIQEKRGHKTEANMTIKSVPNDSMTREEFEFKIPVEKAYKMSHLSPYNVIEKERYVVSYKDHIWAVDIFCGNNAGLVVAEIELGSEDEYFERPDWIGQEVTDDLKHYNENLAIRPFKEF